METIKTDVFVLGGGLSGVSAAVAAARCGARVMLAERHFVLGGTATEALVNPWQTFHAPAGRVIGGFAQELTEKLAARGWSPGHLPDPIGFVKSVTPVDPDGLKITLDELMRESGINVLYGHRLRGIETAGGRIKSVALESEQYGAVSVSADFYVDASGNGDMTDMAGCRMEIDPDCQPMTLIFVVENVDFDAVAEYQREHPDEFYKSADTTTLHRGYIGVSGFFEHVRRAREAGRLNVPRDRVLFFGNNRPGQVVVNTTRVTDFHGIDGREVSEAMRAALAQVENLFGFMTSELPGFSQASIARIADHIGVRETRRLVGRYVMDENDIHANANFDDAIAKGAYPLDIHSGKDSTLKTELIAGNGYYDIPLRCLLNNEIGNLITVGKCMSVTHVGFSSTRVMPTCMAVGQGGGAAAALAAKMKKDPAEIAAKVRDAIRAQGAIVLDEDIVREKI